MAETAELPHEAGAQTVPDTATPPQSRPPGLFAKRLGKPALSFVLFHRQVNEIADRADGLRRGEVTDAPVKMEPELLAEGFLGQLRAVLQAALS